MIWGGLGQRIRDEFFLFRGQLADEFYFFLANMLVDFFSSVTCW